MSETSYISDDPYTRNRPYVQPGNHEFNTKLRKGEELRFQNWLRTNKVPFDPTARVSDYDMRGFWRALQQQNPRAKAAIDPNDDRLHYPDYWKTPLHETFSNESQWATPDAPHWEGDQLVDSSGMVRFDDQKPSGFPGYAEGGEVIPGVQPSVPASDSFWGTIPTDQELEQSKKPEQDPDLETRPNPSPRDFWGELPPDITDKKYDTLGVTPQRQSLSLEDTYRTLWGGTIGIGEGLIGAVQYITGHGGELREALKAEREYQVSKLSPESQKALNSSLFSEGEDSLLNAPFRSLTLKAINMAPQLVGAVIPGSLAARAVVGLAASRVMMSAGATATLGRAGAGAGIGGFFGATTTGDVFGAITDEMHQTPDAERQKTNPFYKQLRDSGMSEDAAFEQWAHTAIGLKPLYAGAIAGLAAGLSEGALGAHLFGHGAVTGALQGAARGAGQGALTMAPQAAATEIFAALGMRDATGKPMDWKQIISDTLEAGIAGGVLGGATGVFAKRVPRAEQVAGLDTGTVDADQQAALHAVSENRAADTNQQGSPTQAAIEHPAGPTIDEAATQVAGGQPITDEVHAVPPEPRTSEQQTAPVAPEPSAAQPAGAVAPKEATLPEGTTAEQASTVNGGAPPEHVQAAVDQGARQPDPTAHWFLDGDKPVYMPPTLTNLELGLAGVLGDRAAELDRFPKIDSPQGPIWYKPGEEQRARGIAKLVTDAIEGRVGGDAAREAAYHAELGRLLGYDPQAIGQYIRSRGLEPVEPVQPPASGWREVRSDEIFPPGRRFRMNQTTGKSEVFEEKAPSPPPPAPPPVTPQSEPPKVSKVALKGIQKIAADRIAAEMRAEAVRRGEDDIADQVAAAVMRDVHDTIAQTKGGVSEIFDAVYTNNNTRDPFVGMAMLFNSALKQAQDARAEMAQRDAAHEAIRVGREARRTTANKTAATRADEDWRTTLARAQKIVGEQGDNAPEPYKRAVQLGSGTRGGSVPLRQIQAKLRLRARNNMMEWEAKHPTAEMIKEVEGEARRARGEGGDVLETSGRLPLDENKTSRLGLERDTLYDEERSKIIEPVRQLEGEELEAEKRKLDGVTKGAKPLNIPARGETQRDPGARSGARNNPPPTYRGRTDEANREFIFSRTLVRDLRTGQDYQPVGRGQLKDFITQFTKPRAGLVIGAFDRMVRDRIRNTAGDTPVYVIKDDDWRAMGRQSAAGTFVPGRTVDLAEGVRGAIIMPEYMLGNTMNAWRTEVILHEGVHAATRDGLRRNHYLDDTLTDFRGLLRHNIDAYLDEHGADERLVEHLRYGLTNNDELLAMGFTNENFQNFMRSIEQDTREQHPRYFAPANLSWSGLRNGWARFVDIVRRALGMDRDQATALDQFLSYGSYAFQSTREMRSRENALDRVHYLGEWPSYLAFIKDLSPSQSMSTLRRTRRGVDWEGPLDIPAAFRPGPNNPLASVTRNVQDHILRAVSDATPTLRRTLLGFTTLTQKTQSWNDHFHWTTDTIRNRVGTKTPMEQAAHAVLERGQVARKFVAEADPIVRRMTKLADNNPKMMERLGRLEVDATNARIHPDRDLADPIHDYLKGNSGDNIWSREQHARLAAEYNALSPEARALFRDQRDFTARWDNSLRQELTSALLRARFKQAVAEHLRDPDAPTGPMAPWDIPGMAGRFLTNKATDVDKELVGDRFRGHLNDVRNMSRVEGPYFPLRRFGDYVVRWQEKGDKENIFSTKQDAEDFARNSQLQVTGSVQRHYDAAGKRLTREQMNPSDPHTAPIAPTRTDHVVTVQNRGLSAFDRRSDAVKFMEELRQAGAHEVWDVERRRNAEQDITLLPAQMQAMVRATHQMGLAGHDQRELQGLVEQMGLKLMAQGSIKQNMMLRRRNVIGASTDAIRGFSSYAVSGANLRARMQFAPQISDAIAAMHDWLNQQGTSGDGKSLMRQELIREMEAHAGLDAVWQPKGYSRFMQVAHQLTYLNFLASPAQTIQNSLQSVMITMPYLGARYGATKAIPALMRAYGMVGPRSLFGAGLKDTGKRMAELVHAREKGEHTNFLTLVKDEIGKSRDADAGELLTGLQAAADRGKIDQHFGQDIYRAASPLNRSDTLQQLTDISWAVPAAVEALNRTTTFIATYRLERERGSSVHKATEAGISAIDNTQFDYSGSNAARLFDPRKHPFLQAPLMFKKWTQGVYYLMGRQLVQAVKGATPQERKEALKTFGGVMLAHALMAGALGLPTDPIKLAFGAASLVLGEDRPIDWTTELRKGASDLLGPAMAEVVMLGLPHALGADMNMRVGLNGLILQKDLKDFKPETVAQTALDYLVGRPSGFIENGFSSYQSYMNGDYYRMAEMALPKIVRDLVRTGRFADQGVQTKRGGQITPVDTAGLFWQALGIQPAAVEEAYAGRTAIKEAESNWADRRGHAITRMLTAGTPAERNQIRITWNAGAPPAFKITYESMAKEIQAQRKSASQPFGITLPQKQRFLYEQGAFANTRG